MNDRLHNIEATDNFIVIGVSTSTVLYVPAGMLGIIGFIIDSAFYPVFVAS